MQLSARNQFLGKIVALEKGAVNGEIKIDIGGGTIVSSNITVEAIEELDLAVGDDVVAIVKASDVMIGK